MSEETGRDPFDSLAPSEANLLPPGSIISDEGGHRWRRLPAPYGAFHLSEWHWWDGHEEVSTADLYKDGRAYWLEKDASEQARDVVDDQPYALIDRDGDLWGDSGDRREDGAVVYRSDNMRRTLTDVEKQYGPARKLYERP